MDDNSGIYKVFSQKRINRADRLAHTEHGEGVKKKAAAHGMVHSQRRRANKQLVSAVVEQLVHKLFKSLVGKAVHRRLYFGKHIFRVKLCCGHQLRHIHVVKRRRVAYTLDFKLACIFPFVDLSLDLYDFSGVIFVVAALIIPHFCRDFAALVGQHHVKVGRTFDGNFLVGGFYKHKSHGLAVLGIFFKLGHFFHSDKHFIIF